MMDYKGDNITSLRVLDHSAIGRKKCNGVVVYFQQVIWGRGLRIRRIMLVSFVRVKRDMNNEYYLYVIEHILSLVNEHSICL